MTPQEAAAIVVDECSPYLVDDNPPELSCRRCGWSKDLGYDTPRGASHEPGCELAEAFEVLRKFAEGTEGK